ncbi:MAG: 2-oxoacid:acceptor oxidoreductase family protein [Bacillota bacterium]|nr:2-oxoacid:acceptor oxidoreductase family protein [Bacillota bacterium]
MKPLRVGLCGFGGQGIILSAVVLGTTAVTKRDMYAVQTQSYGSEARGGQCQAELILSEKPINSPTVLKKDILVCLFQTAVDRYLPTLKEGGILIIDPNLVTSLPKTTAQVFEVPATETAIGLGNRLAANMVVLGFIQEATGLMTRDDLVDVVKSLVSERFWDLDVRAVDAGIEYARSKGATIDLETVAA